jgi:hypothetical protein
MPIRKDKQITVVETIRTFTTIRNTNYFSDEDCSGEDFPYDDMDKLKNAERFGEEVEVVREYTNGYYDIEFVADGHKMYAISWLLLDGYTADGIEE